MTVVSVGPVGPQGGGGSTAFPESAAPAGFWCVLNAKPARLLQRNQETCTEFLQSSDHGANGAKPRQVSGMLLRTKETGIMFTTH